MNSDFDPNGQELLKELTLCFSALWLVVSVLSSLKKITATQYNLIFSPYINFRMSLK